VECGDPVTLADLSFETFFAQHFDSVRRSLSVALGDAERGEEFAQEAFTRALSRWRVVSGHERPATWVYVVAVRAAGRRLSDDRRPSAFAFEVDRADVAGPVATAVSIRDALKSLAPRQRLAVVLRYLVDLPLADVAEVMGCSVGTVKSTLHTALGHLRVEFDERDEGEDGDAVYV
jgi:RNA polymerase sigma-70 factor (ECF subfamily)